MDDKLKKYVAAWNGDEGSDPNYEGCPYCGNVDYSDLEFQGEVSSDIVTHLWHCHKCGSDIYAEYRICNIFVERPIEGETDYFGYPKTRVVGEEEWL